jgi:hypothetical protein
VLQPPTWGVPILVAFYDMHGLQWGYSFPQSPHEEKIWIQERRNISNMEKITYIVKVIKLRVRWIGQHATSMRYVYNISVLNL